MVYDKVLPNSTSTVVDAKSCKVLSYEAVLNGVELDL
jgi:hypothetical protein